MSRASRSVSGEHVSIAVLATMIVAAVVLSDVLSFTAVQNDQSVIAHANASANPYQPVRTYGYPSQYRSSSSRVFPELPTRVVLPRATLERKIKTLQATLNRTHKQLMRIEDRVSSPEKKISGASAAARPALQRTLDTLTKTRNKLEDRFADLNTQIAAFQSDLSFAD